jgi:hypothetical protein
MVEGFLFFLFRPFSLKPPSLTLSVSPYSAHRRWDGFLSDDEAHNQPIFFTRHSSILGAGMG